VRAQCANQCDLRCAHSTCATRNRLAPHAIDFRRERSTFPARSTCTDTFGLPCARKTFAAHSSCAAHVLTFAKQLGVFRKPVLSS
jgi:hypothetical protein